MKCRKCKSEIPKGNRFCPNCGEKVKGGKAKWIVILIIVVFLVCGIAGMLNYFEIIEVPDVRIMVKNTFDNSAPVLSKQASGNCYVPNEDNIVYENNDKSLGYVNNMVLVFFKKMHRMRI